MTVTTDPIDIIVTGFRLIDVATDPDGNPSNDWVVTPCMYVDCDEDVYVRPDDSDEGLRLYCLHDHLDDELLFCCRDHTWISNAPSVVGKAAILGALDSWCDR